MNEMKKKILIATGGTGGHIYPALAVALMLKEKGHEAAFIGVFQSTDIFQEHGFSYTEIPSKGFIGKSFVARLKAIPLFLKSLGMAYQKIQEFQPHLVLGFGGFASFSTMMAAILLRKKTMIHEQNVQMGASNKILMKFCHKVCVGFHQAIPQSSMPLKMIWTGTPFRVSADAFAVDEGRRFFQLQSGLPVVFVFGGSQGSQRINQMIFDFVKNNQSHLNWQMIHVTGEKEFAYYQKQYQNIKMEVRVFPYLKNIAAAYAVADIAVTRAGAGTITELALLGIPAVVIPYPGAQQHQSQNADVLRQRKSTIIILEKDLSSQTLGANILRVLKDKISREELIGEMKKDLIPKPTEKIVFEILKLC